MLKFGTSDIMEIFRFQYFQMPRYLLPLQDQEQSQQLQQV